MTDSNVEIVSTLNQEISGQHPTESSSLAKPSTSSGAMFKKRAKTTSAQKGLRRPINTSSAPVATPHSEDDDDDDDNDQSSDDERGVKPLAAGLAGRKRKRGGFIQAGTTRASIATGELGVSYDVNRNSNVILDPRNQATAISAEFTEAELLGKSSKPGLSTEAASDNVYRGQKNYRQLLPQREQITTKYNSMGPQKAASNIRMTTVTDYAPDICKDYKLTGYCGFGDNCKFLHDRGDYKAGWQIDRDWEIEQQKKNDLIQTGEESDSDDDMDNVPFVCLICREDYEDPVVTKCGHYFCMTCAIKRYKKTPNCIVCGTGTMGIFNKARDFEKKLEAKRKRKEKKERRKQGLIEDDDEVEAETEAATEFSE